LNQQTISRPVSFSGFGLWSGNRSSLRLRPAPAESGVVFKKNGATIPVNADNCFLFERGLGMRNGTTAVLSVEHLLAAIYGLGVDNIEIEVDGDEVPLADGSALPFASLLAEAGIVSQPKPKQYYYLKKPLLLASDTFFLTAVPCPALRIGFFYSAAIPKTLKRWISLTIEQESFLHRIAPARTFGHFPDRTRLEKILSFGIHSDSGFLYPEEFRLPDEMVAHKVLDLLGGLAVLGRPFRAQIFALGSGHGEHLRLVKLLSRMHR